MIKNILIATLFMVLFLAGAASASAAGKENEFCLPPPDVHFPCDIGFTCRNNPNYPSDNSGNVYTCQRDVFGTIQPPEALKNLIGEDPTGAGGISRFLSNLVAMFYGLAGIVLIFMLLWGAWDWMTSEGDKEKLDSARKKIINAIVGIVLFSIAFALIQILGQFTGFKFFVGQK